MSIETALFFESPEQIYARVFRILRPRTPLPEVRVEFKKFANLSANIRWQDGRLLVRASDLLEGAPAPVTEALAYILVSKMLRQPVPSIYQHRYRLYLNRREVRRSLHLVRQERGRKHLSGPEGSHFDLVEIFEEINQRFFHGLMARPELGWSLRESRRMLGHYDPSHNAIILSQTLDRPGVPRFVVEYVMFHEMLHLRHPVEHKGSRRRVHTREFKLAEKEFPRLAEVKEWLKRF